ncbi:protein ripply1 [Octodon degus]|uniref:Protein ripply1 n=1 Tax=Octodon degus TaxID=10160 RepID=A0A6P3FVC6_OCTDE|nr:protein ripply1 [Octodon degus]
MDPVTPTIAAPGPPLVPALAPTLPPGLQVLPGLLNSPPLVSSVQELPGIRRGASLWRPWMSSTNNQPRQVRKLMDWMSCSPWDTFLQVSDFWFRGGSYLAINFEPHAGFCFGQVSAKASKADSQFHHPVRLFWPKSCSFDYLYSAGEILLQNFPVQATINLYEDSNSEEEAEEGEDEEEKEEANERRSEVCAEGPGSTSQRVIAHLLSPSLPQSDWTVSKGTDFPDAAFWTEN